MKVQNVTSANGRAVPNQFIINKVVINSKMGDLFQSYDSVIAFIPYERCGGITADSGRYIRSTKYGSQILLDKNKWDYSRTTGKYRNRFLGETKRETEKKIKFGEYLLTDLN